jgi:hypothetical protein
MAERALARASVVAALLAFETVACGAGGDDTPAPVIPEGECRTREVRAADGRCACPPSDVLCPTRGYAHFTISNVEDSGLPHAAKYEVSAGLVRDLVTGLTWEASPPTERTSWADAKARCAALEIEGRDDFRLPGRIELVTILDFDRLPVAASPFENTAADYHFSSSPASFARGSAYSVYFGAGETAVASANPGSAVSRCVASAVAVSNAPQLVVMGDLVIDTVTGLEWERTAGAPSSFDDATTRCASLDMRLPSVRELQSLVDENQHAPALDPELFPDAEPVRHWSSTWRGSDPWQVDFTDGQTYADESPDAFLASRCVR